jgi:hypothetical protein
MDITMRRICTVGTLGIACMALGPMACLSDDGDPGLGASGGSSGGSGGTAGTGPVSGGTGGSAVSSGGSAVSSGGSGGSSTGATKCATSSVIAASATGIADFEDYTTGAELATWNFPLGGDSSSGILAGTFVYGDEHGAREGLPEVAGMVEGNNGSMYALSISDTMAEEYGGGMGLWLSTCLDLRAFTGISFWVRGNAPATTATLTLLMEETTSSTPSTDTDAIGTCMGTDDQGDMSTCKPPKATFTVTDTWTQVQVPWTMLTPGDSAGTAVPVDGHNIWQIQYDIGVVWADDGTGVYMPTPAPYELVIDDLAFY